MTMPVMMADRLSLRLPDPTSRPLIGRREDVTILRECSLTVGAGEAVGLVGESGSGKSSLGRTLLRLYRPTGGRLWFRGTDITDFDEGRLRPLRADMQLIFQDPLSALNPRHRVARLISQPLRAFGRLPDAASRRREIVADLLSQVGLEPLLADRYPHELSGGQRQRVGIARAIALRPAFILADEIVSGLDVSTQARILDLLGELTDRLGLALLFISHDLAVVRALCGRVAVMLRGRIVESGACEGVFAHPAHPHTRALIDAIPLPEVDPQWLAEAPENGQIEVRPGHSERMEAMGIEGVTALVTGSNRGIGRELVLALLRRGATKIYAGTRDSDAVGELVAAGEGRVQPLLLDVTEPGQVAEAARRAGDVGLLINNAGVNRSAKLLADDDLGPARAEMETNYFGTLRMCRAFAPILAANGGGTLVNMASITARVNLPLLGSLSASKAANLSLSQGVRAELAGQGTQVICVMPGAVDTDMTRDFPPPKTPPADIAEAILDAVEGGEEDIYPGDMAAGIAGGLAADPKAVEKQLASYL